MTNKYDDESITTMFRTFVHNHRISKVKEFWGAVLVMIIVIGFFLSIGSYLVYYCGERYPGKEIGYCMDKMKQNR